MWLEKHQPETNRMVINTYQNNIFGSDCERAHLCVRILLLETRLSMKPEPSNGNKKFTIKSMWLGGIWGVSSTSFQLLPNFCCAC